MRHPAHDVERHGVERHGVDRRVHTPGREKDCSGTSRTGAKGRGSIAQTGRAGAAVFNTSDRRDAALSAAGKRSGNGGRSPSSSTEGPRARRRSASAQARDGDRPDNCDPRAAARGGTASAQGARDGDGTGAAQNSARRGSAEQGNRNQSQQGPAAPALERRTDRDGAGQSFSGSGRSRHQEERPPGGRRAFAPGPSPQPGSFA